MNSSDVKHDYHLVSPSPWPIVTAASAGLLAVGGLHWMKPTQFLTFLPTPSFLFVIALVCLLSCFAAWWVDVIDEAMHGDHKPVVKLGLRYGMILFIASEVMFFVAWFWAYFAGALYPNEVMGNVWPPKGIETFDPWALPLIGTLVLLLSGTTITWAHHALLESNRKGLLQGLALTAALGLTFTFLQASEYSHAAFAFSGNYYGASFFMATGFHGFHVIVGTIFLAVCLWRAYLKQFKPEPINHFGFEAAAWYWHFVDVVWLFLFASIYVYGASTIVG